MSFRRISTRASTIEEHRRCEVTIPHRRDSRDPMASGAHPAEAFEAEVAVATRRARLAAGALVLTVLVRVYLIPVRVWQTSLVPPARAGAPPDLATAERSDLLVQGGVIASLAILLVTGVLFLRWLHRTVKLTRALGGDGLRFTPRDAVLGFVIPFLNFKRPFEVVRDTHDQLAPDAVPEPPMQVQADELGGYRQVAMRAPPPPAQLPHASIGAWWGFFWASNLVANFASRQEGHGIDDLLFANTLGIIADGLDIIAASLGVLMVRGVSARLVERYRRVRHNPPEALQAAGIVIGEAAP